MFLTILENLKSTVFFFSHPKGSRSFCTSRMRTAYSTCPHIHLSEHNTSTSWLFSLCDSFSPCSCDTFMASPTKTKSSAPVVGSLSLAQLLEFVSPWGNSRFWVFLLLAPNGSGVSSLMTSSREDTMCDASYVYIYIEHDHFNSTNNSPFNPLCALKYTCVAATRR